MDRPNVTTEQAGRCLTILQAANEPTVAAEIAAKMNLAGCRETQRRHVRAIIKQLRDSGEMIVADLSGGYWLTDDNSLWKDYLEGRQIDAKKILGETHKKKNAVMQDASGQELLFDNRVSVGCATVAG
ncbi:MAG: hypothetical protein WC877_03375 [Dehalococcoidales bacterium]|jgi:hypothetical protein|nr:hypothetical protein [Candidatus Neomarinimicrobiota bacterium]